MADLVKTSSLLPASDVVTTIAPRTAPNGIRFAAFGETKVADADLQRIVHAVPALIAPALADKVFYFVPLAIPELQKSPSPSSAFHETGTSEGQFRETDTGRTFIATDAHPDLLDEAICHRNVQVPGTASTPPHEGVIISARLLRDTFALAFEFFINVGHAFADQAGIPERFSQLVWSQALAEVRGETSQDAFETRAAALLNHADNGRIDEKARLDFLESSFADALAIYQLSLAVDFDYAELREREYPLLAPAALADRLRLVAQLFPPNHGYEFSIRYRRRT